MCDTLCVVGAHGTLFAKNSDRPPGEIQVARAFARRPRGRSLRTQYLDLGPDPGAAALWVASQPAWLWGLEHGINEHRVAIGNQTVYTIDDRWAAPAALLGMDIVRLALERASTADEALTVVTALVERHGQGGSGWQHERQPYFSSFVIADPNRAWLVETSGRIWVAAPLDEGGAALSNRLSLGTEWTRASPHVTAGTDWQRWRDPKAPTAIADLRLAVTRACATASPSPGYRSIIEALRDHGTADGALPAGVRDDWAGVSVCMHVRGYQATTASCVAELPRDPEAPMRHWVALGSPCASVYVPGFGGAIAPELAEPATWQRFARLRDRIESDPTRSEELAATRAVLDPVEAELWEQADLCEQAGRWEQAGTAGSPVELAATAFAPVDAALTRLGV